VHGVHGNRSLSEEEWRGVGEKEVVEKQSVIVSCTKVWVV
jgi:hypothetical protein